MSEAPWLAETCELHSESQSQERATEMESDINVRGAVLGCKHVNCIQRANHRKGQLKRKHINVQRRRGWTQTCEQHSESQSQKRAAEKETEI